MIDKLLSILAPHYCCGCQKVGSLLCNNCKYNIVSEPYSRCLSCLQPAGTNGICQQCDISYSRGWCVGERSGVLERLINDYKFMRVKVAYGTLAGLLLKTLPDLPKNTIIVPIPTVARHIRQRGYDHTLLIAREIAHRRGHTLAQPLVRLTTATQRSSKRSERIKQAKQAFDVVGTIQPGVPYLLIDDVVTTGATVAYAAKKLQAAGATDVWVAIVARSPLD